MYRKTTLSISDKLMRAITFLQFLYDKWSLRHANAGCQRCVRAHTECFLRPLKQGRTDASKWTVSHVFKST